MEPPAPSRIELSRHSQLIGQLYQLRDHLTALSIALQDHWVQADQQAQALAACATRDALAKFTLGHQKKTKN